MSLRAHWLTRRIQSPNCANWPNRTALSSWTPSFSAGQQSIPGAFVGGILVGLVETYAQFDLTKVTGASSVALLVVLVAVLLVRPTGILGTEA